MESLKDKLTKEIDVADWSMLEEHFERGAMITVSSDLDLIDAAVAVAEDKVELVKEWLREGALVNTSHEDAGSWKKQPHQKIVEFVIVQPYVLVQKIVLGS